jgi:hypothetical protein
LSTALATCRPGRKDALGRTKRLPQRGGHNAVKPGILIPRPHLSTKAGQVHADARHSGRLSSGNASARVDTPDWHETALGSSCAISDTGLGKRRRHGAVRESPSNRRIPTVDSNTWGKEHAS